MGRRSGGSNKSKGLTKKPNTESSTGVSIDNLMGDGDLESLLFKPMPPNKRNELNSIVEKLLNMTSNYVSDEPTSTAKLRQELDNIFELVQKVMKIEEQFNMSRKLRASRKPYLKSLVDWLISHGATIKGVEPADYGPGCGFGLCVTEDLKRGDRVISIPRRCFMSTETAKDSTISTLIDKDPMLKSMPNVALALHLLIEKNSPASFWEPYINVLPNCYSTVLYFSPEDFDQLKGSPAYEDSLRQFKYVTRQYAYFYRKFQATMLRDYFTFEDYRWAVSTVMTRQNQVPCKDNFDKMTNTLIPFWDLANHEYHKESEISTDFDEANDGTICMANRDFVKGEQFTIYYGKRSNADLLVHNGFVYTCDSGQEGKPRDVSYPHDSMVLKIGIARTDPLAQAKYDILNQLSIPVSGGHFVLNRDEKPFDNVLLAFLRVLNMTTKEEIAKWESGVTEDKSTNEEKEKEETNEIEDEKANNFADKVRELLNDNLSDHPELDKKVYKYLETRCTLLLRSYASSLEDDLKQLNIDESTANEKVPSNLNVKHCILLRSQEKQILNHVIDYCRKNM